MALLDFPGASVELTSAALPETTASPAGRPGPGPESQVAGQSAYIIAAPEVTLRLPRPAVSYYRHGWQSWSLSCWHDPAATVPVQKPTILQPMQTDPRHAHRTDPSGSWIGAVRFGDGRVLLLGALETDARVELSGNELHGYRDDGEGELAWLAAYGSEESVFAEYAAELGRRLGVAPGKPTPRVWCSWYSYYTGVSESIVLAVTAGLGGFPVDTIQIDDGWQTAVGDWEANAKFSSGMARVAEHIREAGKTAGLWLAPLITVKSSRLARNHPDWLLRDAHGKPVSAGFNWGEQLYALDTTRPAVLEWLDGLLRTAREWGFDYFKLDFLYGGALPGVRSNGAAREAAYRDALAVMREAMGDAYFVACAAPIVPSVGLCDALRIGPDVAGFWESHRDERLLANPAIPGTRTAIRTTVHRLWLGPVFDLDPDVVYLSELENSLTPDQRRLNQALAHVCRFVATSDPPSWLAAPGQGDSPARAAFREPEVRKTGPYTYEVDGSEVDFSPALGLPGPRSALDRLLRPIVSWAGGRPAVLRIVDAQSRRLAARRARTYASG